MQFYNQGGTTYNTYETLFKKSNGWSAKTSVKEIIDQGVPASKIVVGKPATQADVYNTGIVNNRDLGNWVLRAYKEFGWSTGVMFWQYKNDADGTHVGNAINQLLQELPNGGNNNNTNPGNNTGGNNNNTNPGNNTGGNNNNTSPGNNTGGGTPGNNTGGNNNTNPNPNPGNNGSTPIGQGRKISYPIRFGYVNTIASWWPAASIAAGMGVPGYSEHPYNYIALAFWTTGGAVDIAKIWEKPTMYMGGESSFGSTDSQIRTALKKAYNDGGVKVMVSAFGSTNDPTNQDPSQVATNLAKFVNDYDLDGCDVDYEHNAAMEAGTAE